MARPALLLVGASLYAGLVVAYGVFAWIEAETRVLAAAEAEGRAVLDSVAAGIRSNLDASAAVESLVAKRLFDLAAQLDAELADEPDALDGACARFAARHGIGAIVLDASLSVRASASGRSGKIDGRESPLIGVGNAEAERIVSVARAKGLPGAERLTIGFTDAPFSGSREFLVGARAPRIKGFVILRQSAREFEEFEENAGVGKLLRDAAHAPGVAYLRLQGPDGRIVAADETRRVGEEMPAASDHAAWQSIERGGRVLDVSLPIRDDRLRVGLAAGPVEELVTHSRRNVVVFTVACLAAAGVIFLLLYLRSRRLAEIEAKERFASLGRLAAGVAHEIRSPLNALSMAAQRLQREAAPTSEPERTRFVELTAALRGGIARVDGTIREFLALGQSGPPAERVAIDVASLVDEVVAAEGADVRRDPPGAPLSVRGDRALLGKSLANLVRNAHQIAPGTVSVAWRRDGDSVVVEVTDGGPGISVADRERIFEPFFTKRPGGTGLGLAIARDAVERQGGRIRVDGAPGGGARFAIELPLFPSGAEA